MQEIHAKSGSTVYAVLHGDMHIRNGYPIYRFEPFPLTALPAQPQQVSQRSETLAAWRDKLTPGVSVLLLNEPIDSAGTSAQDGFALDSDAQGWAVWAGHHVGNGITSAVIGPTDAGEMLLLIVDHADRWPTDDLQLLIQNPLLRRPRRARVLLIAHVDASWWPAFRHRLGKAGFAVGGTLR